MCLTGDDHAEKIERLASVGATTTEIMHELNNHLTSIIGYATILRERISEASIRADLAALIESCDSCHNLAKGLMTFVRGGHAIMTQRDLVEVVLKVLRIKMDMSDRAGIQIQVQLPKDRMEAMIDEFQMQQVVLNILHNAYYELLKVDRRMIEIKALRVDDSAIIMFRDSGPGISFEHRDRIFDPFFSAKPAGEGTGLGLSISRRIVRNHGGNLYAEKGNGAGATFILAIPLCG